MSARVHMTVVVLALALLSGSALAAPTQWQAVATNAGSTVEIDKSRISRLSGGKTAAWTRLTLDHPVLDFENQIRYTTVQALNHYDCAAGSFTTQQRVYLLENRAMKTEKVTDKRQIKANSDSFDARLMDEVCKPRTVGEMQQAAARTAQQAAAANADAPRAMHAEMVSAGDAVPARSIMVADKPRLFELPVIDKSKAEDPLKGSNSAAVPAPAPAPAAKLAAPQPTVKAAPLPQAVRSSPRKAEPAPVQELTRQQRELQLATSGPRKAARRKPPPEAPAPPVQSFENVRWGYAGLGAPENWAKLHPNYAVCETGKRQSPIDIRGDIKVDLEPIRFDYRNTLFRITDNGHTIQVDVAEGSTITVTGRVYRLQGFEFHRPAEVRINGKPFDMALHLVHKDYDNNMLIIAVLLERGDENPLFQALWNHMPLEVGMDVTPPDVAIDLAKLLPVGREYYTHMGSLTTPPCTENVRWVVFKEPLQISPEQIAIFARLYPNNARPLQPVNDRLIKESR